VACRTNKATSCTNFGGGRAKSSCGVLFLFNVSSSTNCTSACSVPSAEPSASSGVHSCNGRCSLGIAGAAGSDATGGGAGSAGVSSASDLSKFRWLDPSCAQASTLHRAIRAQPLISPPKRLGYRIRWPALGLAPRSVAILYQSPARPACTSVARSPHRFWPLQQPSQHQLLLRSVLV